MTFDPGRRSGSAGQGRAEPRTPGELSVPIMPAGMPPGTEYPTGERAPEGVVYFRIYAGLFAFFHGLLALAGGGLMLSPLFLPRRSGMTGSGGEIGLWVTGLFYGGMGLAFLVPTLVALFAGRRPWAHTLGTVVIALGMFNVCCIPVLIPVLIVWMKVETRQWYGAT